MPKQLKILLISKQYPPAMGGGGAHSFYLADALARHPDVQIHVLTSSAKNMPPEEKIRNKNLFIHRIDFGHSMALPYEPAIQKGLQLCKDICPHLLHAQHTGGSLIGLHLKASFHLPLLVTLHKTPIKWDKKIVERAPLYSYMKLLSQLNIIDLFIAGSQAFRRELQKIGVPEERIRFIYHGVPIRTLERLAYGKKKVLSVVQKLRLERNDNLIVCPARIDDRKQLDVFIKAAGLSRKELPDKTFKFLITGSTKTKAEVDYKNHLESMSRSSGVHDCLRFDTFDFEEIPALYRLAKVCVLPSSREGLGLVLLESLAVKTPVVVSKGMGVTEVVKTDERHGLFFLDGDYVDLKRQLVKIFTNKELVSRLRKTGHNRVKKHFDADMMANNYLKVYKEMIQ
ncbi:MAG: glycosyltransferase family 4 protein [Nitrospinae bacterium]|nr:glycosyltransferase family 4 protein [Nitrospinota bacterium]